MYPYRAHADPPRSFTERLRSLNDSLQGLAGQLKDSIAQAVSSTISQAIRDLVRRLLGDQDHRTRSADSFGGGFHSQPDARYRDRFDREDRHWDRPDDDPWNEESEDRTEPREPDSSSVATRRWNDAFRTAIQSALCWLTTHSCRRPILTTALVALATGGTALIAGPTLAAGVGVIASIASLVLTTDSVRSACNIITV